MNWEPLTRIRSKLSLLEALIELEGQSLEEGYDDEIETMDETGAEAATNVAI